MDGTLIHKPIARAILGFNFFHFCRVYHLQYHAEASVYISGGDVCLTSVSKRNPESEFSSDFHLSARFVTLFDR